MNDRDLFRTDPSKDWVIVGWFSPDYRPLAEKFAQSLRLLAIPHHLFARPQTQQWDTSSKPLIVLHAMNLYRGKTIILMDVDCIITGDISPLANLDGDVSFNLSLRRRKHERMTIYSSSRVVVFKPTAGARRFAEAWAYWCDGPERNDEINLTHAYVHNGGTAHVQLPARFAAWEVGNKSAPEDVVIWHQSAHRKSEPITLRWLVRSLEKPFRRGRTKAIKAAGARPRMREAAE